MAKFTGATEYQRGPETSLFTVPEAVVQRANASFYDIEPRDERFLMVSAVEAATAPRLMLVQNFAGSSGRGAVR